MKKRAWLPSVWTAALRQTLDLGLTGGPQNARPGVSRPKNSGVHGLVIWAVRAVDPFGCTRAG
jgi:hypothetical protein